jgi:hypothetical protein
MSSYHSSFKYLNKKSDEDFGWIIGHFDPDNGETDSYLSQDQIYTESYNGTKRTLYGTKYNSVANVKITVIKQDGSDFTLGECREAYKWLTGNPEASWMDLYIGDEVKYRLLCTIQDVKPQKMDARTVGLNIYCESLSPWAYSPLITVSKTLGTITFDINNETDDLYTPVYLKTTYTNLNDSYLYIDNATLKERTSIDNLSVNETIVLDGNMMITSDKPNKVFGNSFNFVWPRLKAGLNQFNVVGHGDLTFEYYYPIKMGDCAQNINIVRDPICDDFNNIQVDTLPWERISGKPSTLSGYGVSDAYTKSEVDSLIEGIDIDDTYTKAEIDSMLENFVSDDVYTKSEIDEKFANIDFSNMDTYTKAEIDEKLNNITASGVDISEEELNTMLNEVLGE